MPDALGRISETNKSAFQDLQQTQSTIIPNRLILKELKDIKAGSES